MTMPRAFVSFGALSSSTSACSRIASSSVSIPSPVFADTGMNWTSPPYSSGMTPSATSSCLTRSGFASGLSILFMATTSGTLARLRVGDRFLRLRHDAVVGGDDDHDDVGDLRPACPHRGERLVARRVEERDHALRGLDVVRADVLRDAAGFADRDPRAPDGVEQRRLAVVDVSHDGDDRRPRQRDDVALAVRLGQQRVRIVELGRLRLVAHLLDDDHRRLLVEDLVDRDHRAHLHHRLDDFGGLHGHLVREVADADRLGNRDLAHHRPGAAGIDPRLVLVAMATGLRLAPAAAGRSAGGVAAKLERAAAGRVFLERGGAGLLGRPPFSPGLTAGRCSVPSVGDLGRRRRLRRDGLRGFRSGGVGSDLRRLLFLARLAPGFLFLLAGDVRLLARAQFLPLALLGLARRDLRRRQHRRPHRRRGRRLGRRRLGPARATTSGATSGVASTTTSGSRRGDRLDDRRPPRPPDAPRPPAAASGSSRFTKTRFLRTSTWIVRALPVESAALISVVCLRVSVIFFFGSPAAPCCLRR